MKDSLLPKGFYDELYPDAYLRMQAIYNLTSIFVKAGYQLVDPPLVEFEDTLLSGQGSVLADQTFRVVDPQSNKMMAIRSDMTVQVARIATSRLKSDKRPLKLSYAGQVLKVNSDMLNWERQLWQAGIELVGNDNLESDFEVIDMAIKILSSLEIKDISIAFTIPSLARNLLDNLSVLPANRKEFLLALEKKDISSIRKMLGEEKTKILEPLLQLDVPLENLNKITLSNQALLTSKRLIEIILRLKNKYPDIGISFDPFESLKFYYHTGIGFSLFAKGVKAELARGGRYEIEGKEPAVGVSFYIDRLLGRK